jgi:peroxiredoxin
MTRRTFVTVTAALLIVGALVLVSPLSAAAARKARAKKPTPPAPTVAALGKPAPHFALADHAGKKVRLADFAGKIVVLEWINPDCPFVKRHYEAGTMKSLAEKYAPKGVAWLAINTTHYWTSEKNAAWARKHKLPYPVLNDQSGDVGRAYGAKTTPDMRIIDAKGALVYAGGIDDDPKGKKASPVNYVAKALDDVLARGKVSVPRAKPYGCSVKYAKPAANAPTFTLPDHNGEKVSLADFAGKIVVLEWINPDCPFVKRHYKAGTMKSLAEKYAPKGVVWLAVNTTHYWTNEKNKAWADMYDLPYPILNDSAGTVGRLYGAKTTPDMRVIDAKGNVAYSGGIDDDPKGRKASPVNYVAKALDELLAGKKASVPRAQPYGCSVKYAKKRK